MKKPNSVVPSLEYLEEELPYFDFSAMDIFIGAARQVGQVTIEKRQKWNPKESVSIQADGVSAVVYCPEGGAITIVQAVDFIKCIETTFGLSSDICNRFFGVLKIGVAKYIKSFSPEKQSKVLKNIITYAKKSGLTEERISEIANTNIHSNLETRKIVQKINSSVDTFLITSLGLAEMSQHFIERLLFQRGKNLIYDYLLAMTFARRQKLIEYYMSKPDVYRIKEDAGRIEVYKIEGESVAGMVSEIVKNDLLVVSLQPIDRLALQEQEVKLKKVFNISYWKSQIDTAPDDYTRNSMKLAAVDALYRILRQLPWDIDSIDSFLPAHIAESGEMQCVGKSIVAHVFLERLGIEHLGCLQDSHLALVVIIDGSEYHFDPINSPLPSSIELKGYTMSGSMRVSNNIKVRNGEFRYQTGHAEDFCYISMCNNLSTRPKEPRIRTTLFTRLLDKYDGYRPAMLHANLGSAYQDTEDYSSAIEQYKIANNIDPKNTTIRYGLAQCYIKTGDYFAGMEIIMSDLPKYSLSDSQKKRYSELWSLCLSNLNPPVFPKPTEMESHNVAEFLSKMESGTAKMFTNDTILQILGYDVINPELWRWVWLKFKGDKGAFAYDFRELLNGKCEFMSGYNENQVKEFGKGLRLYYSGDGRGLYSWFLSLTEE